MKLLFAAVRRDDAGGRKFFLLAKFSILDPASAKVSVLLFEVKGRPMGGLLRGSEDVCFVLLRMSIIILLLS